MYKYDFLYVDTDGLTYVNYDSTTLELQMKYTEGEWSKALVANPDSVDYKFPRGYGGPHYIEDDMAMDFRVVLYEYRVDTTAIPPALVRFDLLNTALDSTNDPFTIVKTVQTFLKKRYQDMATKSDRIAMEMYKKKYLLPDYNIQVDPSHIEFLQSYPGITQKYNAAKSYLQSLTPAMLADPAQRPGIVKNLMTYMSPTYFE